MSADHQPHDLAKQAAALLQDLIARETGAPLHRSGAAELDRILARFVPRGQSLAAPVPEPAAPAPVPVAIELALGAEAREVTVLLADLRGFTALTATQPARSIVRVLNRCLDRMAAVIARHGGHIDKFLGDAILVVFGLPEQQADDSFRALACAIEMQIAMRDIGLLHLAEGLPELYLGVGINTGTVVAGRFGSGAYSEYTLIGDGVNLVSRIESFCLRGQVLISEATYRQCGDAVSVTEPLELHVKGRSEPVQLRELIAIPGHGLKVPRQEFRRSHRVEVHLPARLRRLQGGVPSGAELVGSVRDIGYHGLLLELDEPLPLGTELQLEFDFAPLDHRVAGARGRIVNGKQVGTRPFAGLEFTHLDSESDAKIQACVQLLVSSAQGG
ncbi:adenylate/guanylate cyclase domain-containing protein [Xylophilus sp.]|uniref:adenylate/guanylate cyclase domain-containing protein n=1 Tax=Xylophilus sp. TaxID=2653893 RepID=UPI0013B86858|nr:adenylate/guanylate cyclase domain-containing protein [Xylophilus sp.]KAF1043683.1 MAG: Adenylate cyclase 1 [Xylophilus sp.]